MAERTQTRKGGAVPLEVPYPSKVALPVRRPAIVHRQRLIESLAEGIGRRVTLVSAPAGYGKTTLLLDFAPSWKDPVCWYALDERDREMETFLRYFGACGSREFPGFGSELAAALHSGAELTPEKATDLMVAAMQAQTQPFVMVFDDFHFLDEAPDGLRQAIEGWLYRLPPHCHVVLTGRTQAQLGILPLMSARQEVQMITGRDFAFTCEEVVQLFRDVLGKEISLDEGQHLADLTEGWAAALVLMADKVKASTSISLEQLRGSDTLFQYITLEQFAPLPPEVKAFLTGSAIPRTMDEELVNELLGISDTEEKLNFLERQNLFVVRDPHNEHRSRYHRLFRAFLVSHVRAQEPERFGELNLKAAGLMEQAEEWEEAVYHYIQAGAWERIVQITERVGWKLFEEGKWDTLAEWLEAVPSEELAAQPKLILWKARILHYLNQVESALALLSQAIVSFEAKKEWLSLAEALVTKGMCLRVKGDYHESREVLTRARTLLLEHDAPVSLVTEGRKELGITLSRCGELAQAAEELKAVVEICEVGGDTYNAAHASDELGGTLLFLGKLAEASNYLEGARIRWVKLGNEKHLLQTLNNLGFACYLSGDYDRAENAFHEALDKARAEGGLRAEAYLLASLGDIRRDRGDYAPALEIYASCLDRAWDVEDAYICIYTMDAIANTYRLMGDINNGESWAQRAMAEAEKTGGHMEIGVCVMTSGLLKRSRDDLKKAAEEIAKAIPHLKQADTRRELAVAYFHQAGVYFSLKRKRLALECLELAAKLVQELGYDHFLRVEAARAPLLVQYAAANKIAGGYFDRLLKALKSARTAAPSAGEGQAAAEGAGTTVYAYGFGNLRVEMDGREITDLEWRSEKGKEMFFFFLCNRRPLRKEEIVTALWPDLPEDKTTSAFHSNMYRLRKALYQDVIAKDSGRYILDPNARFSFDVEEFQGALGQAEAATKAGENPIPMLDKALELHKGPFAPDFYTEWAETLRWQMEEQHMSLLTTLAASYNQSGDLKRSAELCQKILEVDEYNEAAWYRLMSSYIQSGQVEAAKFCYNRYAQIIAADEGADEVAEFEEVCREIAAGKSPV
ncbi:MAG: tetratricopeptide repeat protein [Dehalococcoidia bacterium]|nr:tetratricopeptide repeat protein [Dehalococcoidia bacterium]